MKQLPKDEKEFFDKNIWIPQDFQITENHPLASPSGYRG